MIGTVDYIAAGDGNGESGGRPQADIYSLGASSTRWRPASRPSWATMRVTVIRTAHEHATESLRPGTIRGETTRALEADPPPARQGTRRSGRRAPPSRRQGAGCDLLGSAEHVDGVELFEAARRGSARLHAPRLRRRARRCHGLQRPMGEDDESTGDGASALRGMMRGIIAEPQGRYERVAGDRLFRGLSTNVVAAVERRSAEQAALAAEAREGQASTDASGVTLGIVLLVVKNWGKKKVVFCLICVYFVSPARGGGPSARHN